MTTAFVITAHSSDKLRPEGNFYLNRQIESIIKYCKHDFKVFIIDNESQHELKYPLNDKRFIYKRVDDQIIGGVTRAWNIGLALAYDDGCDILINCNDDLWFNDTINDFIEYIENTDHDDIVYGHVSDGILLPSKQHSKAPYDGKFVLDCKSVHGKPVGFCFAFTSNHYLKYRYTDTEYFNRLNKYNGGGDGKWGGQEGQFQENAEKGLYAVIVTECFVHHDKIRGWTQLKIPETNNSYDREEYEKRYG